VKGEGCCAAFAVAEGSFAALTVVDDGLPERNGLAARDTFDKRGKGCMVGMAA